ncbi:MAG TPA: glutamate-1-semialdehyde 2,1-aminomutase [Chthoniobacterales bacterium]|jgi:glutamate-1-semialdehyde 2,1-aminomutase|nr:glutamate-1-semialdehyde 2,1-aminomutase [Chthoniobacterales bacterium]
MSTFSSDLFARARAHIPGGVNSPVRAFRGLGREPFFVERASGARIWDVDGEEYIDYVGTWGPAILGHAPAVVIDAVCAAAARGVSFGIPNPLEVEMAELICRWVPSIEKVRMVNSGTEATMSCVRLARGFTRRDKIIKFEGCYHGHVDSLLVHAGSGALTHGQPDSAGVPEEFAGLTIALPFNDLEAVRHAFRENRGEIAAIILEPIPANAGLYFPKPGFLEGLRAICDEEGALLMFDEVMTGFRVARGGAQEIYGIRPDLTALGKVIGGGLPVGAFGGRKEIMDELSPLGPVYQAGTLSGNPLAMAAGLAQLRELERIDGWKQLEELGAQLEAATKKSLGRRKAAATFQRIGSMFCLFFTAGLVSDLADARRSDIAKFGSFFNHCLEAGIYFAPSQFESGFISTAHQPAQIDATARIVDEALAQIFR